ncbi:hypothetical protein [Cupriavidus gilardii]|uniref:hypothetical protein n=1 Tax=Cupriavidus gilardii TaxID=82541 RepID=UPI001572A96A|nr:hypothetical protein [Cupriavidus gilardii]NSX03808.1 hypothetical protein [Cupriavidus gilardii]
MPLVPVADPLELPVALPLVPVAVPVPVREESVGVTAPDPETEPDPAPVPLPAAVHPASPRAKARVAIEAVFLMLFSSSDALSPRSADMNSRHRESVVNMQSAFQYMAAGAAMGTGLRAPRRKTLAAA